MFSPSYCCLTLVAYNTRCFLLSILSVFGITVFANHIKKSHFTTIGTKLAFLIFTLFETFLPFKNLFRPSKLFLFNKLCSKTKQLGRFTKIWKGQKRFFKVLKFVKLQNETFWIIFKTFCDSYLVLKPLKVELRRNFLATNSRLLTKVKNFSHDQLFIQESYFRPTTAIHDVVVPSLECLLLHKMMIDFDAFVSSGTTQGKSLGNRKVLLIGWL